jgi:RNA polymerase sigma-70 factor, ECF subfamily
MKTVSITVATWQEGAVESSGAITAVRDVARHAAEEAEWVARARRGDLDAFSLIYQRYEGSVYRHACRLLGDPDRADDIRQETFIRAYQSVAKFRGDSRLKTYLFAICGNLCRDALRHERRHPAAGYGLDIPETGIRLTGTGAEEWGDPLAGLERAADAARVQTALARLAPADREMLLLRYVEGLELHDIAEVIGCTTVSIPVRLFRARKRLKDLFLASLKEGGE